MGDMVCLEAVQIFPDHEDHVPKYHSQYNLVYVLISIKWP